jgi:hypothetical protein
MSGLESTVCRSFALQLTPGIVLCIHRMRGTMQPLLPGEFFLPDSSDKPILTYLPGIG